jgi:hypothetical protein
MGGFTMSSKQVHQSHFAVLRDAVGAVRNGEIGERDWRAVWIHDTTFLLNAIEQDHVQAQLRETNLREGERRLTEMEERLAKCGKVVNAAFEVIKVWGDAPYPPTIGDEGERLGMALDILTEAFGRPPTTDHAPEPRR